MSHKLVKSHHILHRVHGDHAIGRFNAKLALFITKHVGTMWCAYVFAVLGVTGVVAALGGNASLTLLVGAISGYFLQLVLLPVIMVGQNVQAEATDARAEADHETLTSLHEIGQQQLQILNQQNEILARLDPK